MLSNALNAVTNYKPKVLILILYPVNHLLMLSPENLPNLKIMPITQVVKGSKIVNLGEVLEIDHYPTHINLIISRLNEKQVLKFDKEASLLVL